MMTRLIERNLAFYFVVVTKHGQETPADSAALSHLDGGAIYLHLQLQ